MSAGSECCFQHANASDHPGVAHGADQRRDFVLWGHEILQRRCACFWMTKRAMRRNRWWHSITVGRGRPPALIRPSRWSQAKERPSRRPDESRALRAVIARHEACECAALLTRPCLSQCHPEGRPEGPTRSDREARRAVVLSEAKDLWGAMPLARKHFKAQISPSRIHTLNQLDLPAPKPPFELFLPRDGVNDVIELFEINQAMNFVLGGEHRSKSGAMLLEPLLKIVRNSDVKGMRAIRQ